jgi:predicted transcriptional regulator
MEKRQKLPIILVSEKVDAYGLNPYEFRLYAHISHRGECYSRLDTIAKICKMSVRKAQYSLKNLCELGLIKKTKRKLTTDIYAIESPDKWKQPESIKPLKLEELEELEKIEPENTTPLKLEEMEKIETEKSQPIFVHAILDLYGLNPYDFRIYAHIAACGGSCESNFETIKNICKMSIRKAQYSVKNLCDLGLIRKIKYKGKKILYVMNSRQEWKKPIYSESLEEERKKIEKYLLSDEDSEDISL